MSFNTALKKTLQFEGGYANDPSDKGKETYCGISRKFWPDFAGWFIVDANKPLKNNQIIDDSILNRHISNFYKANFWDKNNLGGIKDTEVAEKVFDLAVNTGNTKFLQEAVNIIKPGTLVVDGKIGTKTISAANNIPPTDLLKALIYLQAVWYYNIVKKNPTQEKFLKSWIRRL